jgi:hypothetical protein
MNLNTKIKYFFVLLFIFTNIYYFITPNEIKDIHKGEFLYLDSLHFAVITQTTVGYGHMYPNSDKARLLVNIHCLLTAYIYFV